MSILICCLVGGGILSGCLSPQQRYRVLSFLFDDVPVPAELQAAPSAEGLPPVALGVPTDDPSVPIPTAELAAWTIHDPYGEKDCEDCHSKSRSNQLVAQGSELCWECHDEEDFEADVLHGPVASGNCVGCHDPHRSRNPLMLITSKADLCTHCHDSSTLSNLDQHIAEQGADCVSCHNPHAENHEYMLTPEARRK